MPECDLSQAVVTYLGQGDEKFPRARSEKLVERFGPDAVELEADVKALIRDIGSSPTDDAADLVEAFRAVRPGFAARHPELTPETVGALAWKWSWDNR